MPSSGWTAADLPDLSGRTYIVTGGNSGLGLETTRALARKGAHVVIACRNPAKADAALATIREQQADADVVSSSLDLASLASVRKFAEGFAGEHAALHGLLNNAGVMAIPRRTTDDGFEMQLGTNHLGHFALTGLLLEPLLATAGSRVVTVSSTAHRAGRIDFGNLQLERGYGKWRSYGQSKLANLLFTFELQRRFAAGGRDTLAAAAHPGYAATNLQAVGPQMSESGLMEKVMKLMNRVAAQSAEFGALPTLYATAGPDVAGGDYYGPAGLFETRGHPTKVQSSRSSHNPEIARRLWEASERLTGVGFDALT
ncbi:MAG: SDR family oxidoreductase [Myxococcales bacterium]|nr:SDR family oxidoreductase [Myxococcales bacterium]